MRKKRIARSVKNGLITGGRICSFLKTSIGKSCGNPKRFIAFDREMLFVENKEIDWSVNVWYGDGSEKDFCF